MQLEAHPEQLVEAHVECTACLDDEIARVNVVCCAKCQACICFECFDRFVAVCMSDPSRMDRQLVVCQTSDCDHEFEEREIAFAVSAETYELYMQFVREQADQLAERRFEIRLNVRLEAEQARWAAMSEKQRRVEQCHLHISNKLLNLACPHCTNVFDVFDGCTALTCSRCAANFCGWCLAQAKNSADAHTCAASCNPEKSYFVSSLKVYDAYHIDRRTRICNEYLNSKACSGIKDDVIQACRVDFEALGINIVARGRLPDVMPAAARPAPARHAAQAAAWPAAQPPVPRAYLQPALPARPAPPGARPARPAAPIRAGAAPRYVLVGMDEEAFDA